MKLTEFFQMDGKNNTAGSGVDPAGSAENEELFSAEDQGPDEKNAEKKPEKNEQNNGENPAKEPGDLDQKTSPDNPRSINDLLESLEKVGKQMQEPGNPDFIEPDETGPKAESELLGPPSGKNMRDAKALIEINDWGLSFGLSKYAKEPAENLGEAMEPYQASEVEKEDLTADLADLLKDSGIELPPWLKFAFTYGRTYGPKGFLAHTNRKLHEKLEKEFAERRAQMKAEFEQMKQAFRDELKREYKRPSKAQAAEPDEQPGEDTEPESYAKATTDVDGTVVYEKEDVTAKYDEFRVRTDWTEPVTPAQIQNAPYAVALQALIYQMIAELKRGEKIILDLLRDGFTQDDVALQTVFARPEKGTNGRKSSYERALLEMIGEIGKELHETGKKISILKRAV